MMKDYLNDRYNDAKNKVVLYSLVGSILINGALGYLKSHKSSDTIGYTISAVYNLTLEDIKGLINLSEGLTDEEKDYLYNEDFLNAILPFINSDFLKRIGYLGHITNISINSYGIEDLNGNYLGYYDLNYPNKLFVRDYDSFDNNKDTLAHEFIHLCQKNCQYNVIKEACAEIISYEYFSETYMSSYDTQVKLVKKLMEIIGTEPIWNYNFTGVFEPIENAVKPYLSDNEYLTFLECLSFVHGDTENNKSKFNTLNDLLGVIYKNKYGSDINDDEIIRAIEKPYIELTRYYFNKKLINEENSYYIDRSTREFTRLSYEEAMKRKSFYAYAIRYDPITKEEAFDAINNNLYNVSRKIDYSNNDIAIIRSSERSYETIISAIIDGVRYENVSVDDLVKQGIINANYFKVYFKKLSAKEYLNKECEDGAKIYTVYSTSDFTLYDDCIEGYFPVKKYIEPITTKDYTRVLSK